MSLMDCVFVAYKAIILLHCFSIKPNNNNHQHHRFNWQLVIQGITDKSVNICNWVSVLDSLDQQNRKEREREREERIGLRIKQMDNMVKNIIMWIFPSNVLYSTECFAWCLIIQRSAFSLQFHSIRFHDAANLNKQIEYYYLCTHRMKWRFRLTSKGMYINLNGWIRAYCMTHVQNLQQQQQQQQQLF